MSDPDEQNSTGDIRPPSPIAQVGVKIAVLVSVVLAVAFAYQFFSDSLKLENLASKETQLRQYQASSPLLASGLAFLLYLALAAGWHCSTNRWNGKEPSIYFCCDSFLRFRFW